MKSRQAEKPVQDAAPMSAFERSPCTVKDKLEHFPKYIRRQKLARLLVQHELFKMILNVKGSVVECGVHHGSGVMTWAKLSSTLEPYNYRRKIIGFDTFEGFPDVHEHDHSGGASSQPGQFREGYDIFAELSNCIAEYDGNRFLGDIGKIELVKGDANRTIPAYLEENKHLLVALLYLDFDIYQPTVTALSHFRPRIPKGGIIAFDEVNNANWPGETVALLEQFDLNQAALQCLPYEPNISFIQV
jgi:hypothetical protein